MLERRGTRTHMPCRQRRPTALWPEAAQAKSIMAAGREGRLNWGRRSRRLPAFWMLSKKADLGGKKANPGVKINKLRLQGPVYPPMQWSASTLQILTPGSSFLPLGSDFVPNSFFCNGCSRKTKHYIQKIL